MSMTSSLLLHFVRCLFNLALLFSSATNSSCPLLRFLFNILGRRRSVALGSLWLFCFVTFAQQWKVWCVSHANHGTLHPHDQSLALVVLWHCPHFIVPTVSPKGINHHLQRALTNNHFFHSLFNTSNNGELRLRPVILHISEIFEHVTCWPKCVAHLLHPEK